MSLPWFKSYYVSLSLWQWTRCFFALILKLFFTLSANSWNLNTTMTFRMWPSSLLLDILGPPWSLWLWLPSQLYLPLFLVFFTSNTELFVTSYQGDRFSYFMPLWSSSIILPPSPNCSLDTSFSFFKLQFSYLLL